MCLRFASTFVHKKFIINIALTDIRYFYKTISTTYGVKFPNIFQNQIKINKHNNLN